MSVLVHLCIRVGYRIYSQWKVVNWNISVFKEKHSGFHGLLFIALWVLCQEWFRDAGALRKIKHLLYPRNNKLFPPPLLHTYVCDPVNYHLKSITEAVIISCIFGFFPAQRYFLLPSRLNGIWLPFPLKGTSFHIHMTWIYNSKSLILELYGNADLPLRKHW